MITRAPTKGKRVGSGRVNITAKLPETLGDIRSDNKLNRKIVERAFVVWFSQTGNTEKKGKLIADTLEKEGIQVISGEMRRVSLNNNFKPDLVVIGSPVFYYEIPDYVKKYISYLPDLKGVASASFVTYGGMKGNQHNAVCTVLEELIKKGAVPVGMESFRSESSYVLKETTDEPQKTKDENAGEFALFLKSEIEKGRSISFRKALALKESSISDGPFWWVKKYITEHRIDQDKCNRCGECVALCPSGAIDTEKFEIERDNCTLCLGCINNCKNDAVLMEYNGKKVKGTLYRKS